MTRRRSRPTAVRVLATAVLLTSVLAGCAPRTPDDESWTDQALQALDDVGSEVATMELSLRLDQRDRTWGEYTKTVAVGSEEAAGLVTEGFSSAQPPPADDGEYRRVTTALSAAADVLADVRIAVVRGDRAAYPGLLRDLAKAGQDLAAAGRQVAAG